MQIQPEEPFEEILSLLPSLPIEATITLVETAKGVLARKEYIEEKHRDK